MKESLFSISVPFKVEFFDVDSMGVVWHGNYVKFMEVARCALLDALGYTYLDMEKDGVAFPVITMDLKFIKSLRFADEATITAHLIDYKDFLMINYEIKDSSGALCLRSSSKQVAVIWGAAGSETLYETPEKFQRSVEAALKKINNKNK